MTTNLADKLREQVYGTLLRRVGEVADRLGIEAYAVGGIVRDLLLGRKTGDTSVRDRVYASRTP